MILITIDNGKKIIQKAISHLRLLKTSSRFFLCRIKSLLLEENINLENNFIILEILLLEMINILLIEEQIK